MAKIENTKAYPTVTPSMEDLLIATDVSNDNETVTFLVSDLIGGAGVLQGLQSVLDVNNTATQNINLTGVGPNGGITVVGTIYPTTITAGGSIGVAGQVLSSTGAGIQWVDPGSAFACCSWNDTLLVNDTSTTSAVMDGVTMTFENAGGGVKVTSPATLVSSGINTFTGEVQINGTQINFNASGQINDSAGSLGLPGQWLTATATGVEWSSTVPATSCCNIQDTLGAGSTAFNQGVEFTGTSSVVFGTGVSIGSAGNNLFSGTNTFSGTLDVDGCLEDSLGSCGSAGQVLISTGTAVQWSNGSGLGAQDLQGVLDTGNTASGANASITITGTVEPGSITDASGSIGAPGQVLSWNGAGLSWVTPTGGTVTSVSLNSALPIGASSGDPLDISPTSGAVVVTPFVFNGGANIGFVPDSSAASQTTTFLRADGTWQVPAGGGGGVTSVTATLGSSAGAPLTIAPTTGAVVIQSNAYTGGSNVGHVPSGGTISTFLRGDGNWAAGVSGVITIDSSSAGASTGNAITPNTAASGAITLDVFAYDGGSNIGYVPTGGTASTFLRGDGTWAAGAVAGVSDLSIGTVVSSTGLPITISPASPATGSVTVTQTRYTGGTNEGCVPRGSGNDATKYLDGTGNWTVPAGGSAEDTNSEQLIFTNRITKSSQEYAEGDYMSINGALDSQFSATDTYTNVLGGAPNLVAASAMEVFAGSVLRIPTDGCSTGKPCLTLCSITTAGVLSTLNASPTVLTIEVWRLPNGPCVSGDAFLAATCDMTITAASTPTCCASGTIETTGNQIFCPGDAMMLTWRADQDLPGGYYQIWKTWIRAEWTQTP